MKDKLYIISQLKKLNSIKKQKKKDFFWYRTVIKKLFMVTENPRISVRSKTFLGGFIAGEGSINVSAKKSSNALFGIIIDPEFSVTQNLNGSFLLFKTLCLFETGSIHFKEGSNAVFVYRIDNRKSLIEKVIPFWETYILPHIDLEQKQRMKLFKEMLLLLEKKEHKNIVSFRDQILPLWDRLRKQRGQKNESFPDLETAKSFAVRKGSPETTRDLI